MSKLVNSIIILLILSLPVFGDDGEYDWVKDYIVVRTSEKVKCDANGNPLSIDTVKKSRVEITQTFTEKKVRNKKGVLVVSSRTRVTIAEDTNEYVSTITEKEIMTGEGMQISSVSKKQKTPTGSIMTVESRNKQGELNITKRVVVSKDLDGITTTTVETPDKKGNLVLRESISSQ